jgi:hypothetical protein
MHTKFQSENLRKGDHLRDESINVRGYYQTDGRETGYEDV